MIVLHRKFLIYAGGCLSLFSAMLFCLTMFTDGQSTWFSNLFFDKLVVFLLTPPFLFGALLIDRSMMPVTIIRTKGRIPALILQLLQQYFLGFVYLTVWFILIIFFSLFKFGGVFSGADAIYLLSWYVRFLLGFLIMVNGSVILKKSKNKLMKSASYIMVYLIFVLEVLTIIPELDQQFGIEINLVFSWMFCNGTMWVIAMPVILIILTGTLLVVTQNEDIF